ncbi:MAG: S9 family peptidase, partial [Opitutaceae bacterium]
MRVIPAVLLMSLCSSSATLSAAPWAYPPSKVGPVVDDYHGTRVADPYRWLEELDSPETAAWVAAQNRLTQGFLGSLPGVAAFRERLTKLWNYPRAGVPFREGGRTFFSRNSGLQNQSVLFVQDRAGSAPRVLIDPNTLAADGTVALTSVNVSRDGRLLAYGTAAAGSDWNEIRVRSVDDGRDSADHVKWVKFSALGWTRDGKGFFYSRYPTPEVDAGTGKT